MNVKLPEDQTLWFRNLPPKASDEGSEEVQDSAEKAPFAVAQRSRHIPGDDPKCKVNVDYKSPPREFRKEPNRKRYKAKIITNE